MRMESHSAEETQALGERFGQSLQPGDIVFLFGGLGAGKTTFVQGIARALGYNDFIRSPTFTLVNEYAGKMPIYHIDLYRLDDIQAIRALGIEEYLYGEGVTLIEWAEKLLVEDWPGLPIDRHYEVAISSGPGDGRIIDIPTLNPDAAG